MIRLLRLGLGAALALTTAVSGFAAPWTGGRGDGNRGAYPDVSLPQAPAVVWKAYLGGGNVDVPVSNTVVAEGNAIVAYGQNLIAFSTETGEVRWFKQLGELPLGNLLLLDNQVIVVTSSGSVTGRNPADGEVIWKENLESGLRNEPTYTDGVLLFTTKSHVIQMLERKTGKRLGSTDPRGKLEASPLVYGKSLVIAFAEGMVWRVEDGIVRWNRTLPNSVIPITPVTDGRLVVVTTANALFGLNPSDGNAPVRWQYPCPDRLTEAPVLGSDGVYLATRTGRLLSLDLASGQDRWTHEVTEVDKDGAELKRREAGILLPALPVANPIVVGKHVLVRMENGLLAAYTADKGKLAWLYRLQAPLNARVPTRATMGGVAIDGQDIYFGGTDGYLYHLSAAMPDVDPPMFSGVMPQVANTGFVNPAALQYLGAAVTDEDSGVQSEQVTMQVDGLDVTRAMQMDAKSGYCYIGLSPRATLEPGMHRLTMTAKDYRGNVGTLKQDFVVGLPTTTGVVPVRIAGEFIPKTLKVTPGMAIKWTNESGAPRTVIADKGQFSSDRLYGNGIPQGESWVWVVPADAAAGDVYYYHCRLNGRPGNGDASGEGLAGAIEVVDRTPAGAAPGMPAAGPRELLGVAIDPQYWDAIVEYLQTLPPTLSEDEKRQEIYNKLEELRAGG